MLWHPRGRSFRGLKAAGLLVRWLESDELAVREHLSGSPLVLMTAAVDGCVEWYFDALVGNFTGSPPRTAAVLHNVVETLGRRLPCRAQPI